MSILKTCTAVLLLTLPHVLGSPTVSVPSEIGATIHDPQPLVNATTPITYTPSGRVDECGDSTFVDLTTPHSPLIEDCLVINKNIADGGRWEVEAVTGDIHDLVQYGTCVLGVKAVPPYGDAFMYIGNSDIIDVIADAIKQFGTHGFIGANGTMKCKAAALGAHAGWTIYHT